MTRPAGTLFVSATAGVLAACCGDPASAFIACPSSSSSSGSSSGSSSRCTWRTGCSRTDASFRQVLPLSGPTASSTDANRRDHGASTSRRLSTEASRSRRRDRAGMGALSMLGDKAEEREHAYEVVFVRHGQSTWNKANRFIGWTDTELTEEGEIEARVAGQVLLSEGYEFDVVYTSMLKRAIKTAWVVLDELSQQHVPVISDWHLNERCYGALVGREKKECVRHFGAEQVKTWRRSYDVPPPPIDKSSKLWPGNNPRYNFLIKDGISQVPLHESLKDVLQRSSSYWDDVIAPSIRAGKRVCVCGHENNMRSLLKHVDGISTEDIINVELPRAVPLVYHLDENLRPIRLANAAPYLSGEYAGDPEEIAAIMERDFKNVYDLSVSQNLEESEKRFAAKIEELAEPCSVEDMDDGAGDAGQGFTGSFLETGVGEDKCRNSEITSTPLLLYNRGQKNSSKKSGAQGATSPSPKEQATTPVETPASADQQKTESSSPAAAAP